MFPTIEPRCGVVLSQTLTVNLKRGHGHASSQSTLTALILEHLERSGVNPRLERLEHLEQLELFLFYSKMILILRSARTYLKNSYS
jgi:hypothetical protein